MAIITSYSTLQTAVGDWLARSDLTTFIPGFIQNWEEDFLREPKNFGRWMEATADTAIAAGVVAVPSTYLALKYAYVSGSPSSRLDRMSLNQLYGTYPRGSDTGLPRWISREGSNFVFGPEPDSNYTIHFVRWDKPTVLRSYTTGGADAVAHYLIVNAPDLCVYGSLLAAEPFIKNDERVPLWQTMYDRCLQSYRNLQKDEDYSGSPLQEVLA